MKFLFVFCGFKDRLALEFEEFADTVAAEVKESGCFFAGESCFFAAALDFHELAFFGHDDVEVDGGVSVFGVVQVEEGFAFVYSSADGGDELSEGKIFEFSGVHEAVESDGDGDATAGDGGGAGSTVGLEDVAIEPEGAGAEFFEVDNGAEGPADEALDFRRSSIEATLGDIAGFSSEG